MGLPPFIHAIPLCYGNALSLTLQKIGTLKFIDSSYHNKHKLSRRRARVDILLIGYERNALAVQKLHNLKQILCRPCKAGKVVYMDNVALSCKLQKLLKLWAVFISFVATALACAVIGVVFIFNAGAPIGFATIAAGLVLAGLSIFTFIGCRVATKGIILLIQKVNFAVKRCFVGKEAAVNE